ncbi:MAG: hypothetical protein RMY64_10370 [Nostoc sp. DedQUE08]|uniref:hypothetical protein n=1 Tax=Nostoc sp. DedQUE08 TaxID=3075393 RepID=UPI002AD46369|nr:hypothetical protein [Nostoc sp. DedQUE08]MDZ8066031.1 hypothetical protein [Nostoc sp. DedQUE08]
MNCNAKTKGNQEAIAEHTEGLQIIDKYLNPNHKEEGIVTIESTSATSNGKTELEELREELRLLKSAKKVN